MPSYAAPLKRTVSEKVETEAADSENSRPPLSESQVRFYFLQREFAYIKYIY